MAGELQIRKSSAQNNRNEMLFLYISTIWAKRQLKHFDKICKTTVNQTYLLLLTNKIQKKLRFFPLTGLSTCFHVYLTYNDTTAASGSRIIFWSMRMLKIAICEDSEIFVEIIKKNIETILKVPYELHPFLSGKEFITSLPEIGCPYDIVFLDISLGEETVSGIELGQIINGENPRTQLIFISQYLEYASDVYSTKHTYFIYKNRLNEYLPAALDAALKNLQTNEEQFLTLKIRHSHIRIAVNDILFLERNLRETFIYTKSETYTVRDKLNILQQQLPDFFVCCHRSFLVNLHAVSRLQHTEITLTTGQQIPVSRAHYENVKKSFSLLML